MGVTGGSLDLGVSEQFSDHWQTLADQQPAAGERVPQIVKAHAAQVGFRTDPAPEPVQPLCAPMMVPTRGRKDPRAAVRSKVSRMPRAGCDSRLTSARACPARRIGSAKMGSLVRRWHQEQLSKTLRPIAISSHMHIQSNFLHSSARIHASFPGSFSCQSLQPFRDVPVISHDADENDL